MVIPFGFSKISGWWNHPPPDAIKLSEKSDAMREGAPGVKNDFSSILAIFLSYLSSFQNGVYFLPNSSGFYLTNVKVKHVSK